MTLTDAELREFLELEAVESPGVFYAYDTSVEPLGNVAIIPRDNFRALVEEALELRAAYDQMKNRDEQGM